MASAESVNYVIRPNKAIERKLVFDELSLLAGVYSFDECRYIGFGALWFVDFVLAHRGLAITDMVSIERDEYIASRAEFNRPYACVSVEVGESDKVLPGLKLEERRVLAWLDYDSSLNGPVLQDVATLCQRAPVGSVVIVTINARKTSLADRDADGEMFPDERERLVYAAGDFGEPLIPAVLPAGCMQASKYPGFLASVLLRHMDRQLLRAGREGMKMVRLFNIFYRDNAPMITVGAAIGNEVHARETERVLAGRAGEEVRGDVPLAIGVPPLTYREKCALDQLMPCEATPSEDEVSQLGFRLKPGQIAAYHRFYRYYPMFGEVSVV